MYYKYRCLLAPCLVIVIYNLCNHLVHSLNDKNRESNRHWIAMVWHLSTSLPCHHQIGQPQPFLCCIYDKQIYHLMSSLSLSLSLSFRNFEKENNYEKLAPSSTCSRRTGCFVTTGYSYRATIPPYHRASRKNFCLVTHNKIKRRMFCNQIYV